ncbi:uncharacterized protein LOC111398401 [Olea europaea var. sylvestris]|uniref:uncharacterized protein LOC111398401 n=1 Tax=Olea europaea var. sylvestris TaxID=158386 RepID=UPI000C1D4A74|nr:uncharacterized protein LOC111398401 [Olea europaea var. sylvestris]
MERISKHLSCTDAQKVLCAEFMSVGIAGHWRESASRTIIEAEQRALTWTQYKDELMGKYFPQALRDQNETKFLQLKQGKMILEDYQRKFEQLSRYAPYLVATEAKKARRFELGLRPKIGGILASSQFTTYSRVLQTAQAISNRYGKTWHISKNYKEELSKKNDQPEKQGKARVFTLTQGQATKDSNAVRVDSIYDRAVMRATKRIIRLPCLL